MLDRDNTVLIMICILFISFCYFGCATIVSGKNQQLSFQSTPDGVTVIVNGRVLGRTPLSTMLPKKSDQTLEFKKDGYQTITMPLTIHLDGWFWGNILLGGLIGSTTDGITGAVHEYAPAQYFVTLQPIQTSNLEFQGNYNKAKIKDFIIGSYRNLSMDIVAGKGDYLYSLIDLLKIPLKKDRMLFKISKKCSNKIRTYRIFLTT
jgi:hypothetical protein